MNYKDFVIFDPKIQEVATDILCIEFWKPEFCKLIIDAAESIGEFESRPTDPVPGKELRIDKISEDLYKSYCEHWKLTVQPMLEKYYGLPSEQWFIGWKVPFIIKYSMNGQRNLKPHFDDSMVSGSIKLNDNYTGAELVFPRQKFTNKEVPVGSIIIWPSSLQHLHYCSDITSGVKYSLTSWTMTNIKEHGILYK